MEAAVADIMRLYRACKSLVLGFDTESRASLEPGGWEPVALVQIATADCVYLFRVYKIKSIDCLLPILESPVYKCGVSIGGDVQKLLKTGSFRPKGFFELSTLARQLGYEQSGLADLAGLLLKRRVRKSKKRSITCWEKETLLPPEIVYAATDAHVGRELYLSAVAEQAKMQLPAIPPLDDSSLSSKTKKVSVPPPRPPKLIVKIPKAALHSLYQMAPRKKTISHDNYLTWHNGGRSALKWTSVFKCPLTGEGFLSGRYGSAQHSVGKGGFVWYSKKTWAEQAAAARCVDCLTFRDASLNRQKQFIGLDKQY
jgi:ribonuclease D